MTDPTPATAPPVDEVEALARRLEGAGSHYSQGLFIHLSHEAARLLRELAKDNNELDLLQVDLGKLLAGVAVAIRGEPPPQTLWSYHDLPERARELAKDKARLDDLERDGRVLCFEINVDGGWVVTLTEDENGEMQHFEAHDLREAIDRAMESR